MRSIGKSRVCLYLLLSFLLSGSVANAVPGFGTGYLVGRIFTAGTQVLVAVSGNPERTCNYYGSQLIFDASTARGKIMYTMILASKAMGKQIDIWFTDSTAPGANETNGCNTSTMAVLTDVGQSN